MLTPGTHVPGVFFSKAAQLADGINAHRQHVQIDTGSGTSRRRNGGYALRLMG
jgi:hypothetical protein